MTRRMLLATLLVALSASSLPAQRREVDDPGSQSPPAKRTPREKRNDLPAPPAAPVGLGPAPVSGPIGAGPRPSDRDQMILDWTRSVTEAERRPEDGWRQDRVASLRERLLHTFKPEEVNQPRPLAQAVLKRLLRGTASCIGRSMLYATSFECGIAPETLVDAAGESLNELKKEIEAVRAGVARQENWQASLDRVGALPDSDAKGELLAAMSLELLKSGQATYWIGGLFLEGLPSPAACKVYQTAVLDAELDESRRVEAARLLGKTRTEAGRFLLLRSLTGEQLPPAVRKELVVQLRPWCFDPAVREFSAAELLKRDSDGAPLLDPLYGTEGYRKLAVRLIEESQSPAIRKKLVTQLGRDALDPQVALVLWNVAKDKKVALETRAAALGEVPRGFVRSNRPETETTLAEWARGDDVLGEAARKHLEARHRE